MKIVKKLYSMYVHWKSLVKDCISELNIALTVIVNIVNFIRKRLLK